MKIKDNKIGSANVVLRIVKDSFAIIHWLALATLLSIGSAYLAMTAPEILGDLTKLNNLVGLGSVFLLELINVLSDQALTVQSLSDWSLSCDQTGDVWIRRNLRQLVKQRIGS